MKKIKSMTSTSGESDSSFDSIRSARIIKHCSIEGSVKQLAHKSKDLNFWLNSAAERYLYYDEALMHNIQPFITPRLAEVADKRLITVKNIGSITFSLNNRGKKVENTLSNVEYTPD